MVHQFHNVSDPLKTNSFKMFAPNRVDLSEFSRHIKYVDINEFPSGGADIIIGMVHPLTLADLPRIVKEGVIEFLQLEIYNHVDNALVYTMQFEQCKLKRVHRKFDYTINETVVIDYHFHAEQVDVMVLDELDDIDRSNWSDKIPEVI